MCFELRVISTTAKCSFIRHDTRGRQVALGSVAVVFVLRVLAMNCKDLVVDLIWSILNCKWLSMSDHEGNMVNIEAPTPTGRDDFNYECVHYCFGGCCALSRRGSTNQLPVTRMCVCFCRVASVLHRNVGVYKPVEISKIIQSLMSLHCQSPELFVRLRGVVLRSVCFHLPSLLFHGVQQRRTTNIDFVRVSS